MALRTRENTQAELSKVVPPMFKERCILRSLKAEFKVSQAKGNPMIVLECELLSPTEYKLGASVYSELDNRHFFYYLMLSDSGLVATQDLMERLGLAPEIDDEQPDTKQFEGLVFAAILSTRERVAKKPNPEKPGEWITMVDGAGQPIKQGWEWVNQVSDILGRAENELEVANRPAGM